MAVNKVSKFTKGLKKYGYWVVLALAMGVLALILALASSNTDLKKDDSFVSGDPIQFASPLATSAVVKDYSNSALQYSKTLRLWEAHKAIDFAAEEGADVFAVLNGTIVDVSYDYLMGNVVKLDVGNNLIVIYKSLANDVPVKVGDVVKKGEVIGKVGNTAKSEMSDGPHLHLETWLKQVNVDPNEYLDLGGK